MRDSLLEYPDYSERNLSWTGPIPSHWETSRGKNLFQLMSRPVQSGDEVVTCFRDGVVTLRKNRRTNGFTESLKEIGYQGIRRGDLVIHAMDAFAGAVGVSDSDGKSTPVYAACRARPGADPHYYALLVRHMALSGWVLALAKGIRERSTDFRFAQFGSQILPKPPLAEQQAIVKYVRNIERKVGTAISAKRRLTALLDEQRMAVIQEAVTRGLLAAKDSPESWDSLELRRIASFVTSGSRGWAKFYADSGDWFLQSRNIGKRLKLKLDTVQCVRIPAGTEGTRTRARVNDLVICITGAMTGNVGVIQSEPEMPTYVNQHVALVRPRPALVSSGFLALALHSQVGQQQFKTSEYGGTKQGLSLGDVRSVRVPVPSLDTQREIEQFVALESSQLETAIFRAEREIALLREYQARLTADVVTGKLDVRAAAAALPDVDPHDPDLLSVFGDSGADGLNDEDLDGEDTTEESM